MGDGQLLCSGHTRFQRELRIVAQRQARQVVGEADNVIALEASEQTDVRGGTLMLDAADTDMDLQTVPDCLPASRVAWASARAEALGTIVAPGVTALMAP